jgi:hypothetical protein
MLDPARLHRRFGRRCDRRFARRYRLPARILGVLVADEQHQHERDKHAGERAQRQTTARRLVALAADGIEPRRLRRPHRRARSGCRRRRAQCGRARAQLAQPRDGSIRVKTQAPGVAAHKAANVHRRTDRRPIFGLDRRQIDRANVNAVGYVRKRKALRLPRRAERVSERGHAWDLGGCIPFSPLMSLGT